MLIGARGRLIGAVTMSALALPFHTTASRAAKSIGGSRSRFFGFCGNLRRGRFRKEWFSSGEKGSETIDGRRFNGPVARKSVVDFGDPG